MYTNALSKLYLEGNNDVVMDLWIGSSEVAGVTAFTAEMVSPLEAAAATPLTVSRIWDRWIDGTYRLAGNTAPNSFSWDLTPLKSGSVSNTTTFAYAQGLYYQTAKPLKAVFNLDTTTYHHSVLLGISTSAANDNTAVVATKLAHWSPLVTGTGETTDLSTDMGALEHYTTNYVNPAIKNLQTAGKNVHIGGLYVSMSGDALSGYSEAEAESWATNFGMIRRALEVNLGFIGIPTILLGVSQASEVVAEGQDIVRAQQQMYAENNDRTLFFDTRRYPTDDKVHFDGQATIDIGADVTAFRYSKRNLGLARITKAF